MISKVLNPDQIDTGKSVHVASHHTRLKTQIKSQADLLSCMCVLNKAQPLITAHVVL